MYCTLLSRLVVCALACSFPSTSRVVNCHDRGFCREMQRPFVSRAPVGETPPPYGFRPAPRTIAAFGWSSRPMVMTLVRRARGAQLYGGKCPT